MCTNKHFTLSDRIAIEKYLKESYSFKAIAKQLNHHCLSVAKETKKHITIRNEGSFGRSFNNCIHRVTCKHPYFCNNPLCKISYFKSCSKCHSVCGNHNLASAVLMTNCGNKPRGS